MNARRLLRFSFVLLPALSMLPAQSAAGPAASYPLEAYTAVGSNFAQTTNLAHLGWDEKQFEAFVEGLRATFQGKPLPLDKRAQQLQEDITRRLQENAARAQQARLDFSQPGRLAAYVKEIAQKFHLQVSDSGLGYALLQKEAGFRPGPEDTVVLSCTAVAADQQTELPQISMKEQRCKVSDLLPGLAEGVQMMAPKGSALLMLPPDLSFGSGEWPPGVQRGAPVLYTVTLHSIVAAP